MPSPCTHGAMRIRYTDSLLRNRLKSIISELSHIHDYCGGEEAALVRWCLLTVEHVVSLLDARTAFLAEGDGGEPRPSTAQGAR